MDGKTASNRSPIDGWFQGNPASVIILIRQPFATAVIHGSGVVYDQAE